MYGKADKERLLKIYKNEVLKNLIRKYKMSSAKAEIGIKKYGLEKDFLEFTDDYQFVEPERVAIEVFEDVLEDAYVIKVNGKFVLGTLKKETIQNAKRLSRKKKIVGVPIRGTVGRRKVVHKSVEHIIAKKNNRDAIKKI